MTTLADITADARQKAVRAALSAMAACVTDDQIALVASEMANQSSYQIAQAFKACAAPNLSRTGALLPYIVGGKPEEFSARLHDAVVVLLGLVSCGYPSGDAVSGRDLLADTKRAVPLAKNQATARDAIDMAAAAVMKHPAPVGSRAYYKAWEGASPERLRAAGDAITPLSVWAALGTSPMQLGVGYIGTAPLKGAVPVGESTGGGATTPVQRTIRDADLETDEERDLAGELFQP